MKTITQFTLGLVASLLVSVGLLKAAEQFDVLGAADVADAQDQRLAGPALPCAAPVSDDYRSVG